MNVESLIHSQQQQPHCPSTHKYKPTIRLIAESQNALCLPKVPGIAVLDLNEAPCKKTNAGITQMFLQTNEYC